MVDVTGNQRANMTTTSHHSGDGHAQSNFPNISFLVFNSETASKPCHLFIYCFYWSVFSLFKYMRLVWWNVYFIISASCGMGPSYI